MATFSIVRDTPAYNDSIGIWNYAVAVSKLLREGMETPLTIGIHGEWGSGKTSLLQMIEMCINPVSLLSLYVTEGKELPISTNMLKSLFPYAHSLDEIKDNYLVFLRAYQEWKKKGFNRELEELKTSYEKAKENLLGLFLKAGQGISDTLWFSAWQFDDPDLIWQGLLQTVTQHIIDSPYYPVDQEFIQQAKKVIRYSVGKGLRILTASITNGAIAESGLETLIEETEDRIKIKNELRDKIGDSVLKHGGTANYKMNLAILIDDLDRCEPSSVIELLERLKIFFDIKGCIFIIAASEEVIASGIEAKGTKEGYDSYFRAKGSKYLEKIIQLPLWIPSLQTVQIISYINALEIMPDIKDLSIQLAPYLPSNPRQIKRIINSLLFLKEYALVIGNGQVKTLDLPAAAYLVLIQFEWPIFYEGLLTYGYSFYKTFIDLADAEWALANEFLDKKIHLLSPDRWSQMNLKERRTMILDACIASEYIGDDPERKKVWECYHDEKLWQFIVNNNHLTKVQMDSNLSLTSAVTSRV